MPDLVVPGIYVAEQQYTLNPLRVDTRCITGFVGITERGPLNTPTKVDNFDAFLKVFGGFDSAGNLPFNVYNYFKCGGAECVIVRVADAAHAAKATLIIPCGKGKVIFEASSVGVWGNYITVRVWHEVEPITEILTVDTQDGLWLDVGKHELKRNDVLRISLLGYMIFRTILKCEEGRIYLDTPVKLFQQVQAVNTGIKAEKASLSLTVSCKGKSENFLHLSMNNADERFFVDYINKRSNFCRVSTDQATGIIKPFFGKAASGGNDGIADISAGDFIGYYNGPEQFKGLGALESRDDIALIAIPDITWLLTQAGKKEEEREQALFAVQKAMVEQAERFPGRFAILDVPGYFDEFRALNWAKKFDSSFAAAYYPAIDMIDPLDKQGSKTVRVPPSGAVCGCIVATDSEKGIFHAPANITLQGAVGLSVTVTDAAYEMLYPAGINMLKYFPGRGIKIWGARTLSSDVEWRYINVRRTFSAICKGLKQGTHWAVFETNDKNLRKRLVRQVSGFLLDLWMEGYLSGSTSEQGYYVRCDDEHNPPENIDKGIVTCEVGLAITKPMEFFKVLITAEKEGASIYIDDK